MQTFTMFLEEDDKWKEWREKLKRGENPLHKGEYPIHEIGWTRKKKEPVKDSKVSKNPSA